MSLPAISHMELPELISLSGQVRERIKDLAMEDLMNNDEAQNLVVERVMQHGNSTPFVIPEYGVIGLYSVIEYKSDHHISKHFTIQSECGEFWQWDRESPTMIFTQTSRVGKLRKTVSLHQVTYGDKVWYHSIRYSDTGEVRNRMTVKCWEVNSDLSLSLNVNPPTRSLPKPTENTLEKGF